MNIRIQPCTLDDLTELLALASHTFDETFRQFNKPEDFDVYMADAFNPQRFAAELSNPQSAFYYIYLDNELAGYVKLNEGKAQSDLVQLNGLEVERIYVKTPYKGRGLGKAMIQFSVEQAKAHQKDFVWLGVWEKNSDAIAFYEKMGFRKVGTHQFIIGEDIQTDYIMQMDL